MGTSSKGKYDIVATEQLTPKDKNGKQEKRIVYKPTRHGNREK